MSFASHLNPEAGTHPATADPREIAAAERATERARMEFPYYEARYGERGRRFGVSDGAWIVTLCHATVSRALEQVRWLGALLSSRGIPQILLERHLGILREELSDARYRVLDRCAQSLRELRQSVLPQRRFDSLAAQFEREVAGVAPFPGMGTLIVSAVADEALGIEHAVLSLTSWASDPRRFDAVWIDAIRTILTRARDGSSVEK